MAAKAALAASDTATAALMSKPNQFQAIACRAYGGGDYAHIADSDAWRSDIKKCGDTLFQFIMIELGTAEDCDSLKTAMQRMVSAQNDIAAVMGALGRAS